MSEDKNLGILKVAKELNIGLGTIAEFLNGKGFKVEARPTTKLTDEMYSTLLKEYQGDKILREEAKSIVIGKIRRDDANLVIDKNDAPQPINRREEEQEEILIKNVGASTVVKPVVTPTPEPVEEETKPSEPDTLSNPGVKIIGKIDLDSLNSKTRPDKKAKEEKVVEEVVVKQPEVVKEVEKIEVVEEKPQEIKPEPVAAKEVVIEVKEEVKVEEKVAEPIKEEKVTAPVIAEVSNDEVAAEDDEVIRAKAKQLTGPKVIGRIELPVNKKKDQPVASSSNPNTAVAATSSRFCLLNLDL